MPKRVKYYPQAHKKPVVDCAAEDGGACPHTYFSTAVYKN